MHPLKVVAVASSQATQELLKTQLSSLDFIQQPSGFCLELSDAVRLCQSVGPDVILVDTTGRELEAGLFIQAIGMNPETPCVVYALHREMEIGFFKEVVRKGATEFIQYPDDPEALEIALGKHASLLSRVAARHESKIQAAASAAQAAAEKNARGKIIAVFAAKGGVGCSTVAMNLAYALSEKQGRPTAFLDVDQVFCNTEILLNQKPSYSLGDIATTNLQDVDEALLEKILLKPDGSQSGVGVHAISASKSVLDDNAMVPAELLQATLDYLTAKYPFVIVDLPTHVLDPYHQAIAEMADELLLVSWPDIPSLHRTRQYLDLAQKYLDMGKVKMVLNRHNMKAAYRMSNTEVEQEFRYPVFARIPNDWDIHVEANSLGSPLAVVNPKSEVVKSIRKLAEQLTGNVDSVMPVKIPGKGFLGQLFKAAT